MKTPPTWTNEILSHVVELQRGFDLPQKSRRPGPYPVLTSGETGGFHSEGPIKGPGVTIGRATNLGKPKWSDGDFWPHNTTMFVKDFKGHNPRWVFYFFQNTDLSGYDSGSVQPMLNRNYIAKVPVPVPPRPEQDAIVDVLGALDDKFAANAKLSDSADEFIHLAFQEALATSPTTAVPLLDVFHFNFGEGFKGEHFTDPGTGRPLIRIRDLKTFDSQVWTTESRPKETLVHPGDVVVGMDAEFRATSWLGEPGLLNQRVCRVTSPIAGNAFTREALRIPLSNIENYKTGTTVIHLNKKDLKSESVALPSREAISTFEDLTEGVYRLRVDLAAENRTLNATRDALLPPLISGEIRVKDAEKMVEGAV